MIHGVLLWKQVMSALAPTRIVKSLASITRAPQLTR